MRYGNEEEQLRKLFVGGISLNTTDEGLREYFCKYGNVTDCVVIKEQGTNRSKGFGFVTFETEEEADKCMNDRPHSLDGRNIDAKRAVSREESSKPGAHTQVKKIFVGGVKPGCDESMLQEYFGQFGSIVSVEIPRDRDSSNPKGFGFVTFDDFDVPDKLVAKRHHDVCGFKCEVKKALSREEMEKAKQQLDVRQPRAGGPMRSGRGGGGGGGRGRGGRRGGGGGDSYGSVGYGGGPMREKYGQSQRSAGPYGGGYGSAGGYGGGYGGNDYGGTDYGTDYSGYGAGAAASGYDKNYGGAASYQGYGSNNGYGSYGGQGNNYYGDSGANY